MNNNPVEVVQEEGLQQYVFTYRCAKSKGGKFPTRSPAVKSPLRDETRAPRRLVTLILVA